MWAMLFPKKDVQCIIQACENIPEVNLGPAIGHAFNGHSKEAARATANGFATGAGAVRGLTGTSIFGTAA